LCPYLIQIIVMLLNVFNYGCKKVNIQLMLSVMRERQG
jgi:hypothetical protein